MAESRHHPAGHPRLTPFARLLDDWGIGWRPGGTATGDASLDFIVGDFTMRLSWAPVRLTYTVEAQWRGIVPASDYARALDFVTGFNARHVAPRATVDAAGGVTYAQEVGGVLVLAAQTYLLAGTGISDGQAEQFLKRSLFVVGDRFRPACLERWPDAKLAPAPFDPEATGTGDAEDYASSAAELFGGDPESTNPGVDVELRPQPIVLSDISNYLHGLGMPDVPVVDDAVWIDSGGTDVDIYLPGEGTADSGYLVFMAHGPLPPEWEADLTHVGHRCNERNVRTALTTTTVANLAGAGHEGWTLVSTAAIDIAEGLTEAQLIEAMRACPQTVGRSVRWVRDSLDADE